MALLSGDLLFELQICVAYYALFQTTNPAGLLSDVRAGGSDRACRGFSEWFLSLCDRQNLDTAGTRIPRLLYLRHKACNVKPAFTTKKAAVHRVAPQITPGTSFAATFTAGGVFEISDSIFNIGIEWLRTPEHRLQADFAHRKIACQNLHACCSSSSIRRPSGSLRKVGGISRAEWAT
jgi:hypothetical protein